AGVKELLSDEDVLSVIKKMAKQRKESIEKFREGGRQDLVDKESEELKILEGYLPEDLPEDRIAGIVDDIIEEMGGATTKEMGAVMKEAMARIKGRADGRTVNRIVRERLS
ncbi:MAG: GatB/YqeY domain-containing protein, partial [Candidatus Omnitrophica bacterium]|nr:GatB/YqeY domain-containing protein [Candidatus Omnitrophota bacterium]